MQWQLADSLAICWLLDGFFASACLPATIRRIQPDTRKWNIIKAPNLPLVSQNPESV
jgi:hypothetical protein